MVVGHIEGNGSPGRRPISAMARQVPRRSSGIASRISVGLRSPASASRSCAASQCSARPTTKWIAWPEGRKIAIASSTVAPWAMRERISSKLEKIDADLFLEIQAILGRDLTEKMRTAYEREGEGAWPPAFARLRLAARPAGLRPLACRPVTSPAGGRNGAGFPPSRGAWPARLRSVPLWL